MRIFRKKSDALSKQLIFITGAPRSGTSMLTKIIDAHPDVAVLMENIFGNRRRHWMRADFWKSPEALSEEVSKIYAGLDHPIVGNKVCCPDVWSAEDIHMFCNLFSDFKILFVVRNPMHVALSRYKRENYSEEFSDEARQHILLDCGTQFHTYASSWRQSIEIYWKLRDAYPNNICVVYYEDICNDFEYEIEKICEFLRVSFREEMVNWHRFPHHDKHGALRKDLKYPDMPVKRVASTISDSAPNGLIDAMSTMEVFIELWERRNL